MTTITTTKQKKQVLEALELRVSLKVLNFNFVKFLGLSYPDLRPMIFAYDNFFFASPIPL